MATGYFERLAARADCRNCKFPASIGKVEAVYCISLQEQPQRYNVAVEHFHRSGICASIIFYRPLRHAQPWRGCWLSHAAVAQHALDCGRTNALILEDDVELLARWPRVSTTIDTAIQQLAPDWWGLYVGHIPSRCRFVAWGLLQTQSTCTHAYVANRPLLEWLASSAQNGMPGFDEFMAIDLALAQLARMYALFPMLACQRMHGQSFDLSSWNKAKLVAYRIYEWVAVLRSFCSRRGAPDASANFPFLRQTPILATSTIIRASGQFDPGYYLRRYPDVAAANYDPVGHYIRHGASEGRCPNAWFNTYAYAREHAAALAPGENPFAHYLRTQTRQSSQPMVVKPACENSGLDP